MNEQETKTIEKMISIYCKAKHNSLDGLCPHCSLLLVYAQKRLSLCRYGDNKPTCQNCQTHCYAPNMKLKIQAVMRYSGPRMIFKSPLLALKHILKTIT